MSSKTIFLSALALMAFAGNSVLCRLALNSGDIDPVSFTAIRLVSGALTLLLFLNLSSKISGPEFIENEIVKTQSAPFAWSAWLAPLMLFAYAALFSFAYITLDTGVGALILFGAVQITMVLISLVKGNRLGALEWLGLLLACSGLIYLVLPSLSTPSLMGFVMMSAAGIAWGVYTVIGQGSKQALVDTSSNFSRSLVFLAVLVVFFYQSLNASYSILLLAVSSGAITSGLGYAIWYAVLPRLKTSQAGVMQLLVPIIAALGGVLFAQESFTMRLALASMLTLGGILLVLLAKQKRN